jgi:pilus assembly protein Flp/PilA
MRNPFSNLVAKFHGKDQGVTALEYALIAALIAVAIVTGVKASGTGAAKTFTTVSAEMPK